MKISKETSEYIQKIVFLGRTMGVDGIIIETDRVRGMGAQNSVVLFRAETPELEFQNIGFNRLDILSSRLNLLKDKEDFSIEANIDHDKDFVRSLILKAKGTRAEYRCANPATIKAPRVINEKLVTPVLFDTKSVETLPKSVDAMGKPTLITIISNSEGVAFELMDENTRDIYNNIFSDPIEREFKYSYPTKTLLAAFKQATFSPVPEDRPLDEFVVGENGIICFPMDEVDVYILKRIE